MNRFRHLAAAALCAALAAHAADTGPIRIEGLLELSGAGATVGTNFDNGIKLAVKEINAAGGILGRPVDYRSVDMQSNVGLARGLAQKAVDNGAYAVMGPMFSGTIMVSMSVTRAAGVPNFTGAEAPGVTQQGNPYIFRTSITQAAAMPKLARYVATAIKPATIAVVYVNNDYGKGARDTAIEAFKAQGIRVVADISTEPGQLDFSAAVIKARQSNADALFVAMNEEESARMLKEARKQNYDKPLVGETTLTGQKVIELAGAAAEGAIAHVGLTVDAPIAAIAAFDRKFQAEYKYKSDHNGLKGYSAMYILKAATEKAGKVDPKALATAMHGLVLSAKDHPGVLLDVRYDEHGDMNRQGFIARVENGRQVIVATTPAVGPGARPQLPLRRTDGTTRWTCWCWAAAPAA